jgi:hypothetical protein
MKILYVDALSTPTARSNVLGIYNAYKRRGKVRLFDYRAQLPHNPASRVNAVRRMNERLVRVATAFKPDLIHVGKGEIIHASMLAKAKQATGAFVFHAFGDWRQATQPHVCRIGAVADVTSFSNADPALNARYRAKGVKRIEFWCGGFDPRIYKPIRTRLRYDSVFMINSRKMTPSWVSLQGPREKFIFALADAGIGVHLFGVDNRRLAMRHSNVFSYNYVTGTRFSKVCSGAKISLGFGVDNVKYYTSWPRLVNSLASGVVYLTRYFPGLEDFFTNHRHLVWFNTIPEAVELAKHYLTHDRERGVIAGAAIEEVRANHTWDSRVAQVIKWAGLA